MINLLSWIFIVVGVCFALLGCLGLVRFPDLYNRMQAATKGVTMGACGLMVGILLQKGFTVMGIKALACAIFIFLTMPVAAHALARGSLFFGIKMWHKTELDKFGEEKIGKIQIEKQESGDTDEKA